MPLLKIEYDRINDVVSYAYEGISITESIRFAQLVQHLILEDLFKDGKVEDDRMRRRNICVLNIEYDRTIRKFEYNFKGMSYIEAIGILVIVQDMLAKELM